GRGGRPQGRRRPAPRRLRARGLEKWGPRNGPPCCSSEGATPPRTPRPTFAAPRETRGASLSQPREQPVEEGAGSVERERLRQLEERERAAQDHRDQGRQPRVAAPARARPLVQRSEEHTSEL